MIDSAPRRAHRSKSKRRAQSKREREKKSTSPVSARVPSQLPRDKHKHAVLLALSAWGLRKTERKTERTLPPPLLLPALTTATKKKNRKPLLPRPCPLSLFYEGHTAAAALNPFLLLLSRQKMQQCLRQSHSTSSPSPKNKILVDDYLICSNSTLIRPEAKNPIFSSFLTSFTNFLSLFLSFNPTPPKKRSSSSAAASFETQRGASVSPSSPAEKQRSRKTPLPSLPSAQPSSGV